MFKTNEKREINNFTGIRRGFFGIIAAAFIFNMFFAGFLNISSHIKELKNTQDFLIQNGLQEKEIDIEKIIMKK